MFVTTLEGKKSFEIIFGKGSWISVGVYHIS